MQLKTDVTAPEGKQGVIITRTFDLPVDQLFKAFCVPELVEQWMGTKVIKLECKKHGSFHFETSTPKGDKLRLNGVIHSLIPNEQIIRTFEMENMPFGVQLEIYEFEKRTETTSHLKQQIIYQSELHRTENLKLPFVQGINWAHNRLEECLKNLFNNQL